MIFTGVRRSYHKSIQNSRDNGPSNKYSYKDEHCHFPYPKMLGQLQFDDRIIKSSSEGQATIESISFKGL